MRTLLRICALLTGLIGAGGAAADTFGNRADAKIEAFVSYPGDQPFVREMVLLTIRGYYGVQITLEELEQPELTGFGWMQLGPDRWSDVEYQGRQIRGYERTIALFPERAGTLRVAPFVHKLKLMDKRGQRFQEDIRTEPVTLEVAGLPPHEGWWLPASALQIEESWDQRPDQIEFGKSAVRTVTLIGEGVGSEMLPPMPELETPGALVYPESEERIRKLTPAGPISSVTWRWRVSLLRPEPATIPGVSIPWYDTGARVFREILLPSYRVVPAQTGGVGGGIDLVRKFAPFVLPAGFAAGLAAGVILIVWGRRSLNRHELLRRLPMPDRDRIALRSAVRAGDAGAARQAALRLKNRRGGDAAAEVLAWFDMVAFGPRPGPLDLREFEKRLLATLTRRRFWRTDGDQAPVHLPE